MKIISIAFLLIITTLGSMAQQVEWAPNGLTWDDFAGLAIDKMPFDSELNYSLGFRPQEFKQERTKVYRYEAYAYIEALSSWVKPVAKTDDLLQYNQVLFNIIELYRRKLQADIDQIVNPYEINGLFSVQHAQCNRRVNAFKEQADFGRNKDVVAHWLGTIDRELALCPNNKIPLHTKSPFGYGMNIGVGYGTPTGSLKNYFGGYPLLIFGFDFAYGKPVWYLNGTLGTTKLRKDFVHEGEYWKENERLGVAIIELACGYPVIDNDRNKLSPFAGLGIVEFSSFENKDGEKNDSKKPSLVDYNVILGLNYDFKFSHVLRFVPSGGFVSYRESAESTVRARVYVTPTSYFSDAKGWTINFSLGIAAFGRRIRPIKK